MTEKNDVLDVDDLTEERIIEMIEPHLAKMYEAGFEAGVTNVHDGPLRVGDRVRHDRFPSCQDGTIIDFASARPDLEFAVVYWRDSTSGVLHHPPVRLVRIAP